MSGSADFNYKVALASGLKSLQAGRLRQAEEQFRYLVQHFPASDGGYRGLAKVLVEQEDRPAALRVLLDGGAALAKAGERAGATALYRDAVALDPHDLAAHRRLAAALSLAGDDDAAGAEYVRYIAGAIDANDTDRARLESTYALERLPLHAGVADIARRTGAEITATQWPRDEMRHAETNGGSTDDVAIPSEWAPLPPEAPRTDATAEPRIPDSWGTAAEPEPIAPPPMPSTHVAPEPISSDLDAQAVEATAARYIAARDPRAAHAAIEAARRYIAEGHVDAASDLLLQLIASGIAQHDAQRLLVDVARSLGKRDVAKAKVQLLVEALRLDGRAELAAEVEQLARAF